MKAGSLNVVLDLDTNRMTTGLRHAGRELYKFDQQVAVSHRALGRMDGGVRGVAMSLRDLNTVLSTLAFAAAIRGAVDAGEEMIALERRLRMVESAFKAVGAQAMTSGDQMAYLSDLANRTGVDVVELSQVWARIGVNAASAGVDVETIQQALEGTLGAAAAFGLTAEQTNRVLSAMGQVAGKGQLYMEELRQQMGEHLPVALQIVSQGLGVTTDRLIEMVGKGEVSAREFFAAWAAGSAQFKRFGDEFGAQLRGQLQALRNTWTVEVGGLMRDGGVNDALAGLVGASNSAFKAIVTDARQSSDNIGLAFLDGMELAATAVVNGWNAIAPAVHGIADLAGGVMESAIRTYANLPPLVREWGVLGAMLLGTSPGKVIAMLAAYGQGQGLFGVAEAYAKGDRADAARKSQSFGSGVQMTADALSGAYGEAVGKAFVDGDFTARLAVLDQQIEAEGKRIAELEQSLATAGTTAQAERLSEALRLREGAVDWLRAVREGVELYQKPVEFSFVPPKDGTPWTLPDPAGFFDEARKRASKAREGRQGDAGTLTLPGPGNGPSDADKRTAKRALAEELRTIREIEASYRYAADALVMLYTDRSQFAARAAQEQKEIKAGLMDERAALFSLSEEDLRRKAVRAELVDLTGEMRRLELEAAMSANPQIAAERTLLDLKRQQFNTDQMRRELDLMQSPAFRAESMAQTVLGEKMKGQDIAGQIAAYGNPDYIAALDQNAALEAQLNLLRTVYEYRMSMEQRLQLMQAQGVQQLVNGFTQGFTSIITSQASVGEAGRQMIADLTVGIVSFFVQWAAQQAAVWLLTQAGLITTNAVAAGGQATQAAAGLATIASLTGAGLAANAAVTGASLASAAALTVAWTPAAVAASIASFGAAAGIGSAAALSAIGASIAAGSAIAASGTAAASGISAAGAGIPAFHDGGMVGGSQNFAEWTKGLGLRQDEVIAKLQTGEMVVPRDVVNDMGRQQVNNDWMSDTISDRPLAINVTAVLGTDDLDRYLTQGGRGAVMTAMEIDRRNNGATTRRIRGR